MSRPDPAPPAPPPHPAGPPGDATVRADERGVTAVEFAFVAPVVLLLCIGVIQFGMLMFTQNSLQHVAREASRRVAVGEMNTSAVAAWVAGEVPRWLAGTTTRVTSPSAVDPEIRVAITTSMPAAAILDPLGLFDGRTLTAEAAARAEWM
jgi:Flp pilus assembly pilin Flp